MVNNLLGQKTNKIVWYEKFFGDKKFIKLMFSLFLPAAIQSLVTTSVLYVDNFFVAGFAQDGSVAKTAIGVATTIINFPTMVIIGLLTSVGIVTAQYYGSIHKDKDKLKETISMKFLFMFVITIPITAILMTQTIPIIEIASGVNFNDPSHLLQNQLTQEYLLWSGISFIPMGLAMTLSFSFKETKRPKIALIAAIIAMSSNIIMDPLLIIYTQNDMEALRNVSLSTTAARTIEFIVLLIFVLRSKGDPLRLKSIYFSLSNFKLVIKNSWQPFINDFLYSFATLFLVICLFRFDTTIHDASTTLSIIIQFTVVIFPGMAASSAILIGSELGNNNIKEAKENSVRLISWGLIICVIFSLILLMLSFFINPILSPNSSEAMLDLTQKMEWIMIPIIISQGMFSIIYFAIKSGGSKFVFFTDGFVMSIWVIVFGSIVFTNSLAGTNPLLFFFLLELNQIVKMILSYFIYKKTAWAKNITNN